MRVDRRRVAAIAVGIGALTVYRTWSGVVASVIVAVLAESLLRARGSRAVRRERDRAAADLPFAADLVAAVLRAGLPSDRAVAVAGEAIGGPAGALLVTVARRLGDGDAPARAWGRLSELPGGERFAATAARSADSGAALAAGLTRLADDLRFGRTAAVEAAAQRAGALVVLPLGLCFLPAFLLSGVAPVIVAVLAGVLQIGS